MKTLKNVENGDKLKFTELNLPHTLSPIGNRKKRNSGAEKTFWSFEAVAACYAIKSAVQLFDQL